MNNPSQTSPLNPSALKADKLLVMLLHYRDVVKQSKLSECLTIQTQTQKRLGAILKEKQYVSEEHLRRGYQLVYERFSICNQCSESHDLQKGPITVCPHCGGTSWFKDNPTSIFTTDQQFAPIQPNTTPITAPPTTTFMAAVSADPASPFNRPIGYQQEGAHPEFNRLIATSNLGKVPDYEKKLQESHEMDLGLSMDELDIFTLEQMEKAAAEKEKAASQEKAAPPKAAPPKTAPETPAPKPKAKLPAPKTPAPDKKSKTDEMAVSADFGDWKKVQAMTPKKAAETVAEPEAQVPEPTSEPVKVEKKGCGKSAAFFLLLLGSLAVPVMAYAFS